MTATTEPSGWLIDKSALVRLGRSPDSEAWADRIERGLVRIATVTLLEVGYSARDPQDLHAGLREPPVASMLVEYAAPAPRTAPSSFFAYSPIAVIIARCLCPISSSRPSRNAPASSSCIKTRTSTSSQRSPASRQNDSAAETPAVGRQPVTASGCTAGFANDLYGEPFAKWAILDSNQGPLPYQRSALTD